MSPPPDCEASQQCNADTWCAEHKREWKRVPDAACQSKHQRDTRKRTHQGDADGVFERNWEVGHEAADLLQAYERREISVEVAAQPEEVAVSDPRGWRLERDAVEQRDAGDARQRSHEEDV